MSHLRKALRIAYLNSGRVFAQLSIFFVLLTGCKKHISEGNAANENREARFGEHGRFLKEADRLILYSLDPHWNAELSEEPKFHGPRVLGEIEITDRAIIDRIHQDLYQRVQSQNLNTTIAAGCYLPRHGLRVFRRSEVRDYTICFQCIQLKAFGSTESNDGYNSVGLENHPAPIQLNVILDKAGIPRDRPNP